MTADQISQLAARQEMPPDGMTYVDWLLWYMLRDIYRDFKSGKLDAQKGAERKQHSLSIWEKESFKARQLNELADSAGQLWKRVEMAANDYRKNRSLKNADKVIEAIYNVPVDSEQNDQTGQKEGEQNA